MRPGHWPHLVGQTPSPTPLQTPTAGLDRIEKEVMVSVVAGAIVGAVLPFNPILPGVLLWLAVGLGGRAVSDPGAQELAANGSAVGFGMFGAGVVRALLF